MIIVAEKICSAKTVDNFAERFIGQRHGVSEGRQGVGHERLDKHLAAFWVGSTSLGAVVRPFKKMLYTQTWFKKHLGTGQICSL
jgi:hypothetical protein